MNSNYSKILILALTISLVNAHGRLISPLSRVLHTRYENNPAKDPSDSQNVLRATNGREWICRHSEATAPQATLTAGTVAEFDYRLTARHVGDCDFSISYDFDKDLNDMHWFKIANFPDCKSQGIRLNDLNRVQVTLPSWLKSGRAVLRWGWYAVHNWPSVEFFNQCSDVEIVGVTSLPNELQTYTLPGVYPRDADEGKGYRYPNPPNPETWMTGPACAMGSTANNCEATATGTRGNVEISTSTISSTSEVTTFSTSATTEETMSTAGTSSEPTTPISTATTCASQTFVAIADCMSDDLCQAICTHGDLGVLCPLEHCQCIDVTTSTSTTQYSTPDSTVASTSTEESATTEASTSTTQYSTPDSTVASTSTEQSSTSAATEASTSTAQPSTTEVSSSTVQTSTSSATQSISTTSTDDGDQVRICYFQNWIRYYVNPSEDVFEKGLDPTLCTHIQYGFLAIEDNTWDLKSFDPNADLPSGYRTSPCPAICVPGYVHDWSTPGSNPCEWPCSPDRSRRGYDGMLKLKEMNPDIKLIASVGGWNYNLCSKTDQAGSGVHTCHLFSTIASSIAYSRAHALKVIAFLRLWGFDGYDVDWEYPVKAGHNNPDGQSRPDDFANYIRFLQILREEFEKEASEATDGRSQLLLTAAVGVGKSTAEESYDIPAMNNVLDLISLMTYDMNGAWNEKTVNFNAPLKATADDIAFHGYPLSVEWAVDYWLSNGASANKLVLGLATYGRGWRLATPGQNQPALSSAVGASLPGPFTVQAGYLAYTEIQDLIKSGGVRYWDVERQVPYVITADGSQWIGYDDIDSLFLKTNFLMNKNLRGAMFWALELDDVDNGYPLINSVKSTMIGYRSSTTSAPTSVVVSTTEAESSTSTPTSVVVSTTEDESSTSAPTSVVVSTTEASTTMTESTAVNLIGYYGNSGACAMNGCTPTFDEIPPAYNVIIMTFLNIDDNHNLKFEISSKAPVQLDNLASEIQSWKQSADPWGRQKLVLVSLGGQNGHWPSTISDAEVVQKLGDFLRTHKLDGIDIDFEAGAIQFVEKNIEAFRSLKNEGFVLCAAPEAAQSPLTAYRPILKDLDWVHPQFYNNPPNAVTTPFVPSFQNQPDWQTPSEMPWWLVTMDTTASLVGMSANQRGLAIPATNQAAGSFNNWDLNLLAAQIRVGDVRNIATWALGYDKTNAWALAQVIAALNDNEVSSTSISSSSTPASTTVSSTSMSSTSTPASTSASDCFDIKTTSECENANSVWRMCSTAGPWWLGQCKRTCKQC